MKSKNRKIYLIIVFVVCFIATCTIYATPFEQIFSTIDETAARIDLRFLFPNEQGGYLFVGNIEKKVIPFVERPSSGIFVLNMVPAADNPDSLVVDYYNKFFASDTTYLDLLANYSRCYRRDDGSVRIITTYPTMQFEGIGGQYLECPYVIEFDNKGELVYSFVDMSWLPENGGGGALDHMILTVSKRLGIVTLNNSNNFAAINAADRNVDNPHPINDSLYKYRLVVRMYDSLGKFLNVKPIIGLDTTLKDSMISIFYFYDRGTQQKEDGTFELIVERKDYYPSSTWNVKISYPIVILNSDFEVIEQKERVPFPLEDDGKTYSLIASDFDKDNNHLVYWQSRWGLNPNQVQDTSIKNIRISIIDTTEKTLKNTYKFYNGTFNFGNMIVNSNGDYMFAGSEEKFTRIELDYATGIVSKDFQTMKFYSKSKKTDFDSYFVFKPIERADGRYEFWGSYGTGIVRLLLSEEDFTYIPIYSGIKEIPSQLASSQLYPNPASDKTTLSLEIASTCNIQIVLSDILGQEVMQIYDGLVEAGSFTRSFNTSKLAKGVYLVKIIIGSEYKLEKLVVK